jgi:hypothetical protein
MTHSPAITLLQGMETETMINELISCTSIRSENVISALVDHYVRGIETAMAYGINQISQQQFSRAQKVLIAQYRKQSDVNTNNSKAVA